MAETYFKILLSLPENECLRVMARIAVQHHLLGLLGEFRGEAFVAGKNGSPPPDLVKMLARQNTWWDTYMRVVEPLRLSAVRGETTVPLTRDVFMALKHISEGEFQPDDSPEGIAACQMIEACRIGIQAAFASAHEHLDRQSEPENVFNPSRAVN